MFRSGINRAVAGLFGVVFVVVGLLGFIDGLVNDHSELLGLFHVDTAHNWVHIFLGLVLLLGAAGGHLAAWLFNGIVGFFYGNLAVLGFLGDHANGDSGAHAVSNAGVAVNTADNWLHLVLALVLLVTAALGVKLWDDRPARRRRVDIVE